MYNCKTLEKVTPESNNPGVAIFQFVGDYRFLSNFYPCTVTFEGISYSSVEHAYQAAKTLDLEQRKRIQQASTAGQAKRLGTLVTLRPDWNRTLRLSGMKELLNQKFLYDTELADKLRATNDDMLIEGNHWHDNFWGSCVCSKCGNKGENHLGNQLMHIRMLNWLKYNKR